MGYSRDLLFFAADVLICCNLFYHYFPLRYKKIPSILLMIAYVVLMGLNAFFVGRISIGPVARNYEQIIATVFFAFILCSVAFVGKPLEIAVEFAVVYICELASTAFVFFIVAIFGFTIDEVSHKITIVLSVVHKILTLLISLAYIKFFTPEKHKIEGKLYYSLLIMPLITVTVGVYLLRIDFPKEQDKIFVAFAVPILSMMNIIVFFIVEKTARLQKEHHELGYLKEKVELEKSYYDRLDEIEQKQVAVRHDIKHYISVMKVFCDQKNYDEIEKLLNQFEQGMNRITPKVYTRNRIINAILSEKEASARKKGIAIDYEIEPNVDFNGLSDIDLISIVGNILENAIRAESEWKENIEKNAEIDSDKSAERSAFPVPSVTVRLFEGDGNFNVLNVSNHFAAIKTEGNKFLTTKTEDGEHGIGLKSVQLITEKHNGLLNISTENNIFDVTLCLPK